nr:sulfotransferase family 2 domain-containing protein [Salinibacter ruber]
MISDKKNTIFVHNYKVAGQSIKQALRRWASPKWQREMSWLDRQFARVGFREKSDYPSHLTAMEIRERFPEIWDDYFTFGFVRNPWAWQVSLYFYMLETESHHQHDLIASMEDFDEYIHWRVNEDKHLQSEFFCDADGRLMVDYIGRLESIREDFQTICEQIGVEASLPHKNASSHRDYRTYYSDRSRELVAEHFQEDIERFGYCFDGVRDWSPIVA